MSESQRPVAPEFPVDLHWFNVPQPISLSDLRGKVVLLHFWTYSSISCLHTTPDLRYLDSKYGSDLAIIGVHVARLPHEQMDTQLQKAINRLHIRLPVVQDANLQLARTYGIKAWPRALLIDPHGKVVGVMRAEGKRRQLDELVQQLLDELPPDGIPSSGRIETRFEPEPASPLTFPGKVLACEHLLYISDSGRNRVLETYHDGGIRRVFGNPSPGFLDGQGPAAAFDNPQGLLRVDDFLYVADAGNHAIRRIALRSGDVDTLAGSGGQGLLQGERFEQPREIALNSPWDLAYGRGNLYIAMAGQHQIWCLGLTQGTLELIAGRGSEGLEDGPLLQGLLAQPMGLCMGDGRLYGVDASSAALRAFDLEQSRIQTLAGGPARLQCPMGLCHDSVRNVLWVADSFNSKIKKIDLSSDTVSTLELDLNLDEPAGISGHGDQLFIANTNAHQIVHVDLGQMQATVLEIHEQDLV